MINWRSTVNIRCLALDCVQVADMLLELCVTELEDVATDSQSGRLSSQPVVVESSHPYTDDTSTSGTVKIPGKQTNLAWSDVFLTNKLVNIFNLNEQNKFLC